MSWEEGVNVKNTEDKEENKNDLLAYYSGIIHIKMWVYFVYQYTNILLEDKCDYTEKYLHISCPFHSILHISKDSLNTCFIMWPNSTSY